MFQKIMALTLMLCLITGMTGLPVTAFGSERDDAEIVAADKAALKIGFSVGDSVYGVTDDLTLPLTGVSGSAITWLSDTPEVMADDGEVTRPDADGSDAEVTLTAMIAYGEAEDTKEFMVMVLKEEGLQMLMGPMSTVVWEGEGSEASPYQVSSAEHLADIPTQGLDKHYIQMTDITLPEPAEGESNWTPIGAYATPFNGTYDGGGHTIYNLTTVSGGGLFNFIMNGTVKNLRLEDADVASASHAGILANIIAGNETIPGGARIINCSTSGTVTGASRVGGLIGSIQYDGSFISWSSSDAQVTVTEVSGSAGGLLGSMYYAVEVRDSYAIGEVNGPVTGGLIGLLNNGQVKRCYAAGTVSGSTAGGLIAIKEGGAVTDSYYDTDATGQASSAGGTGIATAEMKQAATYTGWNLSDIWNMNEGSSYPVLRDLTGCHIVTYLPNGGTGSLPEGAGKGGEAYTLQAADVFTPPEGRSFKEWNTAADGKGAAYAAGAEITMPEAPLTLYAIWARAFEWVGEGTAASPWQVSAAEHLDAVRDDLSAHYIQTADIDLAGTPYAANWAPIGNDGGHFSGTYDGGGHTITGLTITGGPQYLGLFGINSGTLRNIGLEGSQIATSAETSYIGSLAGQNNGLINACYVKNPLVNVPHSFSCGGGLVGHNNTSGTVAQSYSLGGSITPGSYSHIGGLVGNHGGILSNCYSTSAVGSGDGNEGGLTATGAGNVYGCHYDRETAGLEAGKGIPTTTAAMKKINTFTGWDFADTWKIHEDGSYPKLQWEEPWTADEEINAAWFVLNWDLIRGSNSAQDNVTTDLSLPASGKQETSISWEASADGYINTASGAVTIPSSEEGDQTITLTATVSKGSGTSRSKSFTVTVKALSADVEIGWDFDALTWDSVKGGNDTQDNVTANLAALPVSGANGTTIAWSAEPTGWINTATGAITRPTIAQGRQIITLTAEISKAGGTTRSKTFTLTLPPPSVSWSGDGSEETPYLVSSPDHLFSVRYFVNQAGVHFKQTMDIVLTGTEYASNWAPIGTYETPFMGNYDGDGHSISNLTVNNLDSGNQGLFGFITGGAVENLHIKDANVTGKQNVGILAGIIAGKEGISVSGGKIINCSVNGTVTGADRVGGLTGSIQHDSGFISGSISTASVNATGTGGLDGYAGGLSGSMYSAVQVRDSYAAGSVSGLKAGGLVGYINSGEVLRCYASGSVTGSTSAGGLAAVKDGGTVTNSYYDAAATGQDTSAGGTGKTTAEMKLQTTFAGWGFTGVWKIGEGVSRPTLFWQPWTVDEEITEAKYALTWEDIRGANTAMNNVIGNLTLPSAGANSTAITWSVPGGQSWLTDGGVISRPAFTDEDKTVVLTAAFSKAGGTNQTKEFTLTIKKADTPTAEEAVTLDHAALSWAIIKNANSAENNITGNLNLPTAGTYGSVISWSASPEGFIDAGTGAVTRPLYNQTDATVILTAAVSKTGADSLTRTFNLTVKTAAATEAEATADTLAWLTWDIIKGDNDYQNNVKTNLNLITTGLYGTTITWWNVSGSSTIHVGSGVVDRPSTTWGDQNVTIKADIQKGSTKLEKEFYLTVKAEDLTDQECVLLDNAALSWDTIKGSNSAEDDITANLDSLPTEGVNGSTIFWAVEPAGQTWLAIPSGALTRPTTAEGNQIITLTATVSKGSEQRTQFFTLVLKASLFAEGNGTAQYPYLVSGASDLELVRSFLGSGNSGVHFRQTADITLTGNWTPLGEDSTAFYGHYDGGGYAIYGLRVDGGHRLSGLFGFTQYTAVLENIRLEDAYIRSNTSLIQNSGALCGYNNGTVRNCSATGQVIAAYGTNQAKAGVLIGASSGTVERCWSAGSVTIDGMETVMAGGLVGQNTGGSITDCYSRASAYASGNYGSAGGLVGDNSSGGVIQKSYSTRTANADGYGSADGGLAGTQSGGGSVSASFYNSQTSGHSDTGKGTPVTTANLKKQTTFTGWDFAADTGVWRIMEDYTYPVLQWQDITPDERTALDVLALSWDVIKGSNSTENNVMTDLDLPSGGSNGTTISWSADPADYINTVSGVVTRSTEADRTVTLTARVNYTGGEEQIKSFNLTIKVLPVVTGVAVNPPAVTVQKGTSYQFGATVSGTNNPGQSVTWSVSGQNAGGTAISPSGLLTVAAGETAETLIIIATSAADGSKSGAATVTVTAAPPPAPVVTSVTVMPGTITLNKGDSHTFSAVVSGTNGPAQSVIWMVAGGNGITAIAADGTLAIAANETASTLTIRATSTVDSTKSGTATVTVNQPASVVYAVTYHANNGSGAAPAETPKLAGETFTAAANTFTPPSGKQFKHWNTEADGTGTSYGAGDTVTMPAGTLNLYAIWENRASGGGGGGALSTPAAPEYKAEVKGENGTETTLPVTVDKDAGTASVNTGSQSFTQGGAVITMPSVPDVDTYSVAIPVPDLSTTVQQGTLTIDTEKGSITVPSNMLTGISGISGNKAEISMGQGDKDNLPEDVRDGIGDRPLISLTLSIDGSQTDWSNPSAPVTVSIPYIPTAAELANPESIVVWYIDGRGNPVCVPNGRYDPATGTVIVDITHFSRYAVVYNKVPFTDVASGAWYNKAVNFIAARDITTGTGGGSFSPDAKLTRGDFLVMLMKAYEIDSDTNPTDNFADAGNTYYTGYLAAAKRLGITSGVGNNTYAPGREITRQEMFTLLYNALKVIGSLPQGSTGKSLSDFIDAGQIAPWAKDAMELLVRTGTVGGSSGKLSPADTTTRAEMAQVLYNLLGK